VSSGSTRASRVWEERERDSRERQQLRERERGETERERETAAERERRDRERRKPVSNTSAFFGRGGEDDAKTCLVDCFLRVLATNRWWVRFRWGDGLRLGLFSLRMDDDDSLTFFFADDDNVWQQYDDDQDSFLSLTRMIRASDLTIVVQLLHT